MKQTEPRATFRGLPLIPEQESEIRHYIHLQTRNGEAWDTPELEAMLQDMLEPPEVDEEDRRSVKESMAAQQDAASDGDVDDERPAP